MISSFSIRLRSVCERCMIGHHINSKWLSGWRVKLLAFIPIIANWPPVRFAVVIPVQRNKRKSVLALPVIALRVPQWKRCNGVNISRWGAWRLIQLCLVYFFFLFGCCWTLFIFAHTAFFNSFFLFFSLFPCLSLSVLVIRHYCLSLGWPWLFIALLWSHKIDRHAVLFLFPRFTLFNVHFFFCSAILFRLLTTAKPCTGLCAWPLTGLFVVMAFLLFDFMSSPKPGREQHLFNVRFFLYIYE